MTDRNIVEVIDRVLENVPIQTASIKEQDLRFQLEQIRLSACYRAPEMQRISWEELVSALTRNLPDPYREDAPDWCKKIGRIMRAEE